jgi:Leucine-rich repeat (LRR) protein
MKKEILEKINEAKTSENLYLGYNQTIQITDEIWDEIVKLTHLKHLHIYNSEIGLVPETISNLINLKKLTLTKCKLKEFPIPFTMLTNLVDIDINENLISELPNEFGNLINLTDLDISENPITKFPEIITKLNKLEDLDLSKNPITDFTSLKKLTNLKRLNLSDCQLNSLPDEITVLIKLQNIRLSRNKLTIFPKQLLSLYNLIDIDIDSNSLTEIPKGISYIENLQHLNLRNNQITNITSEIFKLKKLQRLRLGNNKITTIPAEISELNNLRDLDIEDNPLNALKFGYIISDKENDFRLKFHILRYEKEEIDILNFNKLKLEISYGENFIFLKNKENYGFIELFEHPEKLEMRREFHKREFYESFRYGAGFLIYVFGNNETQKKFLTKIRTHIDNWILKQNIEFDANRKGYRKEKFAFRFFYFPISEKFERETIIDYDKLLKFNEAKENVYFDDDFGKKLPIIDLLKYVGAENVKIEKKWKGTNYITTARVLNFKIFKNIEIKLSKNINILLGNNGLGKTSLLQAITLGLLPIENNNYPDNLNDFINFSSEKSDLIINWGENENRKLFIFSQGKPAEEEPITPPSQLLLSYGVNFNTNKEQDHSKIVNELVDGYSELYFTKSIFEDNYRNLYDPLIILKYLDDKIITSKGLNKDNIKERVIKEYGKTKFSDKSISKQISEVTTEIVFINQLILNTLNEYLSLVEKSEQIQIVFHEKEQRYYFTDLYKNKLELQQLSEGYKDHVLLITDILVRILSAREKLFHKERKITINKVLFKKINAVILIDEFDRHLHPSWQRKLLSKFKDDFPNIQFILTTHNPMSILDRDANEIIELKTNETGNIIPCIHAEGTKYLDISKIYLKYFVKDIVSKELHDDIEEYNELLISNKTNTDEFKQLETKLKAAHIGYSINDLRYWKFLDFLKKFPENDPTKNNEIAGNWDFSEKEWNDLLNEIK